MRFSFGLRRRAAVFSCVVSIGGLIGGSAALAASEANVTGVVASVDGEPIAQAIVTISGNGVDRTGRTNARGYFTIDAVTGGTYTIRIMAQGYDSLSGRTIDVRPADVTNVTLELLRSSSSLTTIGRVGTRSGEALSTASVPTQELNAQAAAARGERSVGDMLASDVVSATIIHPSGANPAAPLVVALRGPDPTETLVDVDGHSLNSGGTGSFDLSLLDPADFNSVQVVFGISPSSLVGPNTIDGAINVRTLEPTAQRHGIARLSGGSFGGFGATVQATGTQDRLGYAFSLHRTTSAGEVHQREILATDGSTPTVGSAISATTALGKLRYTFGRGDAFAALTFRSQTQFRDLSAALTSIVGVPGGAAAPPPSGDQSIARRPLDDVADNPPAELPQTTYNSFAGSSLQAHNAGYGFDLQLPLGPPASDGFAHTTLLFRHLTSGSNQSVFGPAAGSSLYLYNDRDRLGDDSLQIDRTLPKATLTLKFGLRNEQLDTQQIIGAATTDQSIARRRIEDVAAPADVVSGAQPLSGLSQVQRSAVLRYAFDPTAKLHYTLATYYSNFNSFGTSLDPRVGFVWTPTAQSAVRFSAGSTFQSPQLPELYVPADLPPVGANGYINIGNPNLKADHATDFDLGFEHLFAGGLPTRASIDLYRTNLRTPAQRYYPATTCLGSDAADSSPASCESFPINAGGAVYQGVEIRVQRNITRTLVARAAYSINSNYATSVAPEFQNGTIVPGEQIAGAPLHRGILSFDSTARTGLAYEAGLTYEDAYNGLNRPAYATLHAGVTWHLPAGIDAGVYGTNLTNVYADKFTRAGGGVPYGGLAGPIATDAYSLQGPAFTFVLSQRF